MSSRQEHPFFNVSYKESSLIHLGLVHVDDIARRYVIPDHDGLYLRMGSEIRPEIEGVAAEEWTRRYGALDPVFTSALALEEKFPPTTLGSGIPLVLRPQGFALGITAAHLRLPSNIGGLFTPFMFRREGRIWTELSGVRSQLAPKVAPGSQMRLVLEIKNDTTDTVRLYPENSYAKLQLVPFSEPAELYAGQYVKQEWIRLPRLGPHVLD